MLGGIGVGAHGQPDVVGHVGAAGEDLGPVDHVLVAVAHGPGAQRRQVGARLGLGVADGEVDVAGQDPGQEVLLLLLGAVAHDGRPDRVDGDEGEGAPARRVSSKKMNWSVAGRPWPPYSVGQPMPSQPSAPILRDRVAASARRLLRPHRSRPGPRRSGGRRSRPATRCRRALLLGGLFEEHGRGRPVRVRAGPAGPVPGRRTVTWFSFRRYRRDRRPDGTRSLTTRS